MSLPSQPPLSEEPEQQPILHSSEETPIQPSLTPDSLSEEAEQQPTYLASEDIPTLPASSFEPLAAETVQQPASFSESDGNEYTALDEDEDAPLDEDDDFEEEQTGSSLSRPAGSGVFIHTGVLIAAAGIIVVAALLIAFLVVANRPKDPPTDWIASYTPPPTATSTSGKILYYLHWTNKNGELSGQLQLATKTSGKLQSLTAPAVGLYNRDNHIIYVVITISGQAPATLTGKINDANNTLTLNQAGVASSSNLFVFHTGNANDYKQATNLLK